MTILTLALVLAPVIGTVGILVALRFMPIARPDAGQGSFDFRPSRSMASRVESDSAKSSRRK